MSMKDWLEKDYYKILGVPKDADAAAIKKAYRKLARELHPDTNPDPKAADRFKEVSEANDVLSDPKKRAEYDEARQLAGSGGFRMPGAAGPGPDFDFGDIFRRAGGAAGDFGETLSGLFNRRGAQQAARRGADVEADVNISFAESLTGLTTQMRLTSQDACPDCAGTGARSGTTPRVCPDCEGTGMSTRNAGGFAFSEPCPQCRGRGLVVDDPCPRCHGSGRAASSRTVHARVPAGVRDGQKVRLRGKGAPGERGGHHGDLNITVHVAPDPTFTRKDDNLLVDVQAGFDDLVLGGQVKVPLPLGGAKILKLPAGTKNGRTFRIRGEGAPRKDGTKGDLLATVTVSVPSSLTDEAREAVEQYRRAMGHG
jgi:molecular chaperone DnaJ